MINYYAAFFWRTNYLIDLLCLKGLRAIAKQT